MTETSIVRFVETKEYRRFEEFCDACRRYSYIGLCYGPPGVGKTLSARYYSRAHLIDAYDAHIRANQFSPDPVELHAIVGHDVVFYTVAVVSSPGKIVSDISRLRDRLLGLIRQQIGMTYEDKRKYLQRREKEEHDKWFHQGDWFNSKKPDKAEREYLKACLEYSAEYTAAKDPTRLIIVDEADRLKMAGLEQMRAIFDGGEVGLILIGMPGVEKRLARYPQLYSRIGFVHEFRVLADKEARGLLQNPRCPLGARLPEGSFMEEEGVAAILRVTGGNFRLLDRLLTQIARVMEINNLKAVTASVVDAARESLVIGVA